jgi:hypothetical protein
MVLQRGRDISSLPTSDILVPFQLAHDNRGFFMHYTYVLWSEKDGKSYTGATADLRQRLRLHSAGRVRSTAHRQPLTLVYYGLLQRRRLFGGSGISSQGEAAGIEDGLASSLRHTA